MCKEGVVQRLPQPGMVAASGGRAGRSGSPLRPVRIQPRRFRGVPSMSLPRSDRPVLSGLRHSARSSPVAARTPPASRGPQSFDGHVIAFSWLRPGVGDSSCDGGQEVAWSPASSRLDMGLACGNNTILDFSEYPGLSIHHPGALAPVRLQHHALRWRDRN